MATLIDSYSTTNENTALGMGASAGYFGQSFSNSNYIALDTAKFNLSLNAAGVTGNATIRIYAHTGTYGTTGTPTGSVLAESDVFDISGLPTYPTESLTTFTFSGVNRISLSAGVKYFAIIKQVGNTSPNMLDVGIDSTTPTASGNSAYSSNGSSWTYYGVDICFYIYGVNEIPTVATQSLSSVTNTTATGHGTVIIDGGATITERGTVISTSANPTISDTKDTAAGTTGAFTTSITGLSPETTYHVRAYATNSVGTSYGADVQFNTFPNILSVSVTDQLNISENTVTVRGELRYWVGGTGDWDASTTTHWSTSSGGAGGASVPTAFDDVFFDSHSNEPTDTSFTVSLTRSIGTTVINNLTSSVGYTWTLSSVNDNIRIAGSLTLESFFISSGNLQWRFESTSIGKIISTNGGVIDYNFIFNGIGGAWTLGSDLVLEGIFYLDNGNFNANNFNITCLSFSSSNSNIRTLTMGSGIWNITDEGGWNLDYPNNLTFNAGTSTIKITNTRDILNYFFGGGLTYYNLWYADSSTYSELAILGSNTFNEIKSNAGNVIHFDDGTTQIISSLNCIGTTGNLITLTGSGTGGWNISDTSGTNMVDYCDISYSNASGGAIFNARNSINSGNNTGWNFITEVNVSDSLNISENFTEINQLFVNVSDSINISENYNDLILLYYINVSDQLNIQDGTSGPNSPGTMEDDATVGTVVWDFPDNAKVGDNTNARATTMTGNDTHYLKATNFGFAIPAGATISGILVEMRKWNPPVSDTVIKLVKSDGTIGTENKADIGTAWSTYGNRLNYIPYGSSSDLWDETWTPEDINDVDFGVVLSATTTTNYQYAFVDHIRITVYYTNNGLQLEEVSYSNVSDQLNISESLNVPPINLSIDIINITENINILIPFLLINVSDQLNISENITPLIPLYFISVSDSINICEPSATYDNSNYTYDSSILDYDGHLPIPVELISFINKGDDVNISENVTLTNTQLGEISVHEDINISENLGEHNQLFINTHDDIGVSELITLTNTQLGGIDIHDDVNISENLGEHNQLFVNTHDDIVISELITLTNTQLGGINIYENINISENLGEHNQLFINIHDDITISDIVVFTGNLGGINKIDSISISELVTLINTQLGGISVHDDIMISELVTLTNIQLGGINVHDDIAISELITVNNTQLGGINTHDDITVSELATVTNIQLGGINTHDDIVVSELITLTNNQLGNIDIHDDITIDENFGKLNRLFVNVYDDISISELVTLTNTQLGGIDVSDDVTIDEDITPYQFAFSIQIFENVTISENFTEQNQLFVNIIDALNISEDFHLTQFNNISTFEIINMTESIILENFRFSPSVRRPVGKSSKMQPTGGISEIQPVGNISSMRNPRGSIKSIYTPVGGIKTIGRPTGSVN